MKNWRKMFQLGFFVLLSMTVCVSAHIRPYTPPDVKQVTDLFNQVFINQSFTYAFGEQNVWLHSSGLYANLILDQTSGSGLVSRDKFHYGFFSAAIKLPSEISSGVVVAFYLSNAETYPNNHDEIDIELLGHDKRNDWGFQTNVYINGSIHVGREEKFHLWFDPTLEYHQYSIIWNNNHVVFLVDNIPVREFVHRQEFLEVYPLKPMSVYATIWDGSDWATHGGKYPVNYTNAPFAVSLAKIEVSGSIMKPNGADDQGITHQIPSVDPVNGQDFLSLSGDQVGALDWARRKLLFYSYCDDKFRNEVMPPECLMV